MIHIFSQEALNKDAYKEHPDIIFHLDTSVFDTFQSLAEADILVMSKSGLSYSAGLMNNKEVYFFPWEFSPVSNWTTITYENNNDIGKQKKTKKYFTI